MDMRMPPGIIAKGLDVHDRSKRSGFQASSHSEKMEQAFIDALTELAQKLAIILEKRA